MNGQRFCARPFEFMEVHSNGSAWMCCHDWLDTSIGNLTDSTLEEVWNSDTAKAIRRSILDGSFSYCNARQCPALVSGSLPLADENVVRRLSEVAAKDSSQKAPPPEKLNLTYDSTCNLKCPSCRSDYIVFSREERIAARKIQNTIFDAPLENLRQITMTGYGDPFASSIYREFLRNASREKYPLLTINILTNGLLLNERMWNSIKPAHDLIRSVSVSIDACSEQTFMENRGAKFSALLSNLDFISTLRRTNAIDSFQINFVVQQNNFREMPDFVRLGQRLGCDRVLFQMIINWGTYEQADFSRRAVHEISHPEHGEFIDVLGSDVFDDKIVNMSNLTDLRRRAMQK